MHDWHLFDVEAGYEVRQTAVGVYEIREVEHPDRVVTLSPDEFEQLRDGDQPNPQGLLGGSTAQALLGVAYAATVTAAASPYAYVSDALYGLWLGCREIIPGVRLGGIYSATSGYHNTRRHLLRYHPESYSIELAMDQKGDPDLAAGLDLTMSAAEMVKRTRYLRRSALDKRDNRLRALREFIGTTDGETVDCRIDGNEGLGEGRGVDDPFRDKSHLWHIHLSFLRAFTEVWEALAPVLSVLAGETWEQWIERTDEMPINTSLGKVKDQQLRWGEFVEITWDKEHGDSAGAHGEGNYPSYIAPHTSWATAQAQVRVVGMRPPDPKKGQPGDMYQVAYRLHNYRDGDSVDQWMEVVADLPATSGSQYCVGAIRKHLVEGQRLRVAVACFRGDDGSEQRDDPVAVSGRWAIAQDR